MLKCRLPNASEVRPGIHRPAAKPDSRVRRFHNLRALPANEYEDFTVRQNVDAFFKTTERWHLTAAEQRALLGVSSDKRWLYCLHDAAPQLSPQELARVRAVLEIDETLAKCVSDPREVALWFRMLKAVPPFSGRTPLALLFRGTPGFNAVAEYLAEWAKQGTKT